MIHDQERISLSHDHLSFSRRIIPGLLALVLFLIFVAFMIGYFLGVKYTTDEFATQIRQETFADQLLVSSAVSQGAQVTSESGEKTEEQPAMVVAESNATPVAQETASVTPPSSEQALANPMRYGAELIGFGTKSAAEDFMQRVASYTPMSLELKERQSKTPRGRIIKWYQVVTGKYEHKQELQKLLDTLIKKERLHDIKIVAYAPSTKDLA